jgi:uncharacterized membrane protein
MLNYEFRLRARKALQNNWQIALLVGLIAALPSLISQLVTSLTGGSLAQRLTTLLESNMDILYSNEQLLSELENIAKDSGYNWSVVVSIVAWLVSPVLSLGLTAYLMDLLRMKAGQVSSVFCRLKVWHKSIGLNIMVALKAFLWALPGLAVTIGATVLLTMNATVDNVQSLLMWANFLAYAGTAATVIPMVLAMLRYAMSTMVLADEPTTGVMQCIRRSKEMMTKQKGNYFLLQLSFIGWYLVLLLLETFLASAVGYVIASTVYMVLNLALNIYVTATCCAFYMNLKGESPVIVLPNQADGFDQ